jgi:hypothetical protein
MAGSHTELRFEEAVEAHLLAQGWISGVASNYRPPLGLDTAELFTFIGATQPKEWERLLGLHGGADNDYHFVTVWRVAGTVDEVTAILADAESLPLWWPAVYLSVHPVEEGGGGVGAVLDHTKGWLPYTLRWTLLITEPITSTGFALEATGDLRGSGRWTLDARRMRRAPQTFSMPADRNRRRRTRMNRGGRPLGS